MRSSRPPYYDRLLSLDPSRIYPYVLPSLVLVGLGLVFFSSTGRDDAYLSYWPAHTLVRYGEILNYNGARVEQSSSLLHVLALALVSGLTGMPVERIGVPFSIIAGASGLIGLLKLAKRLNPATATLSPLLGMTSTYYVYWSFSGLDTTLMALTGILLILACASYVRDGRGLGWAASAIVMFVLVRPEAPIVLGCMLAGAFALAMFKKTWSRDLHKATIPHLLTLALVSGLAIAGVAGFRIIYFGSLFPQPVVSKVTGLQLEALRRGLEYLRATLVLHIGDTVVNTGVAMSALYAVWTLLRTSEINFHLAFSLLMLMAYGSFILLSGGDWMEGGRFVVHVWPVAISMIPFAMASRGWSNAARAAAGGMLITFQLWFLIVFATNVSTGMPVWSGLRYYRSWGDEYGVERYSWFERTNRVHLRDIPTIDYLDQAVDQLLVHQPQSIQFMSHQMGMVPYYVARAHFGEVQFTDIRGLADRKFTSCPVAAEIPRSTNGLQTPVDYYFVHQRALHDECGFIVPDIIYGVSLDDHLLESLADNSFTIVYIQQGEIGTLSTRYPGTATSGFQYVAVRNDVLPTEWEEDDLVIVDYSESLPQTSSPRSGRD